MKPVYLTPGPSELYFTVQDHMRTAMAEKTGSISHRSEEYRQIFTHVVQNLHELLDIPDDFAIVFTSSATEIWERIIQNFRPHHATFFVNGSFSQKFSECASALGTVTEVIESLDNTWPHDRFEMNPNTDLIAIAQNETSIGMATPADEITEIAKKSPGSAMIVDMVSALPYCQPDWQNWDSVYFSVQKGFGLPAGLGVWIVRKSIVKDVGGVSPHRNLKRMMEFAEKQQNPETPNVLGMYLLAKVTEDMLRRGIENIRIETNYKSALMYHTINELDFLRPYVKEEKYRSKTTLVAECIDIAPQKVIDHLRKSGLQIGTGYGPHKDSHIRIANFPTHSREVFELLTDKLKEI